MGSNEWGQSKYTVVLGDGAQGDDTGKYSVSEK